MKFHLVVPSPSFDEGLAFFLDELGFTLERITPSENPSLAILTGFGISICLDKNVETGPVVIRVSTEDRDLHGVEKTGPNGTKIVYDLNPDEQTYPMSEEPSTAISEGSSAHWTDGRAGMKYRNLLPQGNWNYIASHIKVSGSGPVPDWVHYHDAQFQIIYCYKGSAKLVYEDQGDPFIFNAGDCVLQPPYIRHQVLESYDGLEVIEIVTPANHSTFSDHTMNLPNDTHNPARYFGDQTFIWDKAANRQWHSLETANGSSHEVGKTGIEIASARNGDVQLLRPSRRGETLSDIIPFSQQASSKFTLWFVLSGTAVCDSGTSGQQRIYENDAISALNTHEEGMDVVFRNPSSDFSLLEVRLPLKPPES